MVSDELRSWPLPRNHLYMRIEYIEISIYNYFIIEENQEIKSLINTCNSNFCVNELLQSGQGLPV